MAGEWKTRLRSYVVPGTDLRVATPKPSRVVPVEDVLASQAQVQEGQARAREEAAARQRRVELTERERQVQTRLRFHQAAENGQLLDKILPPGIVARLSQLPTPTGLGLVIAAILFMLAAIIPMGPHGETRLELVWRAFTGGAHLPVTDRGAARQAAIDNARAVEQAEGQVTGLVSEAEQAGNTLLEPFWATEGMG